MGSVFAKSLEDSRPAASPQSWLWVPYDQLSFEIGPLARAPVGSLGMVVIECPGKARRRPYHKHKLALVLSNLRHFALEAHDRGIPVRYAVSDSYAAALEDLHGELGVIEVMEPAERELRAEVEHLVDGGLLDVVPNETWLTTRKDFESLGAPPWRMDSFYRQVRKRTGILMEKGKPVGGKYSFDAANRKPWKGTPPAPERPRFERDAITDEVCQLVEELFADHPGRIDREHLPASAADADAAWRWAMSECLPNFGPYEDAMSTRSTTLFHSLISPLLNLGRLSARRVVRDVLELDIALNSKEGFVRQVVGWREFMRHVHRATDGFRDVPDLDVDTADSPGDGNWQAYAGQPWPRPGSGDGGAAPNFLGANRDLPPAFWGAESGLACLDHVVKEVWDTAYGHHITRLMVLSNLATLLAVSPRQLADWFWVAYADAYDWVVEGNVLGMGTFALGPLFTTKPYVSGTPYINKMSDYCDGCAFNPKKNCPISSLYWAFLDRNQDQLGDNNRLRMPMASLRKRGDKREQDARTFERVSEVLGRGERLTPELLDPEG
ncbi:MAG: cryptochrome/photolyase family protein [Deltaproteobacteria bacterium]|nr:cryptochrome/photolyase family protein [Deltaproteobacteria bacterium]